MPLCVSWGGWKDGATCWGAAGTWELVGNPLCPVDAEQHCSPSSVLGPDRVSCADSVGLCLGDEMRLKPIVGNKWVLFTAGKEVWKYSVKWWGEKDLPWRKPVSPRKAYGKLQLCKHGQFPQQSYRPSSKVLPDKLMHLPALIFWVMLLSLYVLVKVSRHGYHPLGTFGHGDLSLKWAGDLTWWPQLIQQDSCPS